MATANLPYLIPVEEYLHTTYRPDCDYVDGVIEERNLGEFDHGDLQIQVGFLLRDRQAEWSIRVVVETRVQVTATRFRIPDVCVLAAGLPRERIIRTPPLLCVEVLSSRDTLSAMRKRVQDFLDMGLGTVWILDPESRSASVCTPAGEMTTQTQGLLRAAGTPIELALADIFSTLDA